MQNIAWYLANLAYGLDHRAVFFDVRVCHPNADSYRDLELSQIYSNHENEKKRSYSCRVLEVEHRTFTPLTFTSTSGMGKECLRFHSRLAKLLAAKKGERYNNTITWIRARTSFALVQTALVCLRGSCARNYKLDIEFNVANSKSLTFNIHFFRFRFFFSEIKICRLARILAF